MSIDRYNVKTTEYCPVCHEKGGILVRIVNTDIGPVETSNIVNWCRNPSCFKYMEAPPNNWEHLKKDVYEISETRKGKNFDHLLNIGERPRGKWAREAENQENKTAAIHKESARVSDMEKPRGGGSDRRFEANKLLPDDSS